MQKGYTTKQKQSVLACLAQNAQRHLSAEEVAGLLAQSGDRVAVATIYRNLEKLVGEGRVLKYTLPDGKRACYQYHEGNAHGHCHLMCSACETVFHLPEEELDALAAQLAAGRGFELDCKKTVLYGRCAACRGKGEPI